MRDMADRTENYPMASWRQTFDRLQADLAQAIALGTDARAGRAPAGAAGAAGVVGRRRSGRSWTKCSRKRRPATRIGPRCCCGRPSTAQHQELVSARLAVPRAEQPRAGGCRRSATRRSTSASSARSSCLMTVLLVMVGGVSGMLDRSAPTGAPSSRSSGCRRSCATCRGGCCGCRKTCRRRSRASCTTSSARCCTAIGMLLGRVKRQLPADSPLVADLEEVRGIAQQTLEKIRVRVAPAAPGDPRRLRPREGARVVSSSSSAGSTASPPGSKGGPIGVIPPEATIHIYRIVQEALTNVSRHSGSSEAWVRLRQRR